ncbi:hypothetical protein HDU76_008879, partial [Blyttiomyces sp. JEL0837]
MDIDSLEFQKEIHNDIWNLRNEMASNIQNGINTMLNDTSALMEIVESGSGDNSARSSPVNNGNGSKGSSRRFNAVLVVDTNFFISHLHFLKRLLEVVGEGTPIM